MVWPSRFALCQWRSVGERMDFPLRVSLDELFSHLLPVDRETPLGLPRKVLFWGERMGGISSYLAGWMAGGGIDVIVLDGANGFDPYRVSSFARKALIPPERLLKKIRIARAFTCYQMATLVDKLSALFQADDGVARTSKPWVILLGWVTTFLDEDVPEREVKPLFERSLRRIEAMAGEGIPFLFFQKPSLFSSKRDYLMKRLSQVSNLVLKVSLEDDGPKLVASIYWGREWISSAINSGTTEILTKNCKLQIESLQ
jgi:hypothetical protein